ncbi:hypothetical protein SMICM17S_01043 [Streptomyces microflavus]
MHRGRDSQLRSSGALGSVILSGGGKSVSTWGLVAFAAYGLVIATVGGYPFEKIKQLGASVER